MHSEKSWAHGWSIDGYPYLSSSAQFLRPPIGSSGAPSRAHRSLSVGREGCEGRGREGRGREVSELGPEALSGVEELAEAFRRNDRRGLLAAVQKLGALFAGDAPHLARRGQDLLTGESRAVTDLEREILKRFALAALRDPERMRAFVENGLPELLQSQLRPHRLKAELTRSVRGMVEVTASSKLTPEPQRTAPQRTPTSGGVSAVSPYRLSSKDEATLSQAVLQLPWGEDFARRWEQVTWRRLGTILFARLDLCMQMFAQLRIFSGIPGFCMHRTKLYHSTARAKEKRGRFAFATVSTRANAQPIFGFNLCCTSGSGQSSQVLDLNPGES